MLPDHTLADVSSDARVLHDVERRGARTGGAGGSEGLPATSALVVLVDVAEEDDFGELVTVEVEFISTINSERVDALIERALNGHVSSGRRGDHRFDDTGRGAPCCARLVVTIGEDGSIVVLMPSDAWEDGTRRPADGLDEPAPNHQPEWSHQPE